jgi:Ca-activated chloride channel family protein
VVRWCLVLAAALALAAPARAAAQAPQNRALIVLDGSLSMNKDAGNGGTRLDAAKAAVHQLLDRLPAGSQLGLRVYGSRLNHTTPARECRDTQLEIPVGPLDKSAFSAAVDGLQAKGMTPIGNSLLATPDDLGSAPGRRSVVLVSDGGDNCAPPDPCKAAAQVAHQGISLAISVVGLQVDPRARRQLQCIARAGGGAYVDVQDAGRLGDELAAALARAFRSYEPSGTPVPGGPSAAQAAPLGTGLYQDVIHPYGTRWYAFQVPAGRRLVTSVTAIASFKATGIAEFHVTLLDPHGEQVDFDSGGIQGRDAVTGRAQTFSPRLDEPTGGKWPPGRYTLRVDIAKGGNTIDPIDIPLEIGVQLLKPGEDPGMVRANGALVSPTPTPTATAKAKTIAGSPGGRGGGDGGSGVSASFVIIVGLVGLVLGLVGAAALGRRRPA